MLKSDNFLKLFLAAGLLLAPTVLADGPVKASPQSIEFFYPDEEDEYSILCTVRLHLTPDDGYTIWPGANEDTAFRDLVGTDGAGNTLQGKFREMEVCYDADGDEGCLVAVYDFNKRPEGGSVSFDTLIDVPVTCGTIHYAPVEFSPNEHCEISIAEHTFRVIPSDGNATDPDNTAFELIYENKPGIADIFIAGTNGNHLSVNIVEGAYDEEQNILHANYVIDDKHTKLLFCLRTLKPQGSAEARVRFSATIGR